VERLSIFLGVDGVTDEFGDLVEDRSDGGCCMVTIYYDFVHLYAQGEIVDDLSFGTDPVN
jgi:hypothetical protein